MTKSDDLFGGLPKARGQKTIGAKCANSPNKRTANNGKPLGHPQGSFFDHVAQRPVVEDNGNVKDGITSFVKSFLESDESVIPDITDNTDVEQVRLDGITKRLLDFGKAWETKMENASVTMKTTGKGMGRTGIGMSLGGKFKRFWNSAALWQNQSRNLQDYLIAKTNDDSPRRFTSLIEAFIVKNYQGVALSITDLHAKLAEALPDQNRVELMHLLYASIRQLQAEGQVRTFINSGINAFYVKDGEVQKDWQTKEGLVSWSVQPIRSSTMGKMAIVNAAGNKVGKLPRVARPNTLDMANNPDGPRLVRIDFPTAKQGYTGWRPGENDSHEPVRRFLDALGKRPLRVDHGWVQDLAGMLTKDESFRSEISDFVTDDVQQALSQLQFQFLRDGTVHFHIPYKAGINGRVYALNGVAQPQSGDFFKAIWRSPSPQPLGGARGLAKLMHHFSNILGKDKESVQFREVYPLMPLPDDPKKSPVDVLVKFVNDLDAGKKDLMNKRVTKDGVTKTEDSDFTKLIDPDNFWQSVMVGRELRNMIRFARERRPAGKYAKATDGELLRMPEVLRDIADNYKTDLIVQLDANNNALQLIGLLFGDPTLQASTGLTPAQDGEKTADVYIAPALKVQEAIPALKTLKLSEIRKIVKKPIFTYPYGGTSQSRRTYIAEGLLAVAQNRHRRSKEAVRVFGVGDGPELFTLPNEAVEMFRRGDWVSVQGVIDDDFEDTDTSPTMVQKRVVAESVTDDSGPRMVYRIESLSDQSGTPTRGLKSFASLADAVDYLMTSSLAAAMDRKLVEVLHDDYPMMVEFMAVAKRIERVAQKKGVHFIKVVTPDGVEWGYKGNLRPAYQAVRIPDFTSAKTGQPIPLAMDTGTFRQLGQGLGAFIIHSHDAYVMREGHRRTLKHFGGQLHGFIPIHDSFGFHPSQADDGQRIVLETMLELAHRDYKVWDMLVQQNSDWLSWSDILEGSVDRITPKPDYTAPLIDSIRGALS